MSAPPIQSVGGVAGLERLLVDPTQSATPAADGASFGQMLLSGVDGVERKVADADAQVRAFALDDSIPLHQVTFALEEAKLSLEMMLQVRARLVEGYQQIMGMQL